MTSPLGPKKIFESLKQIAPGINFSVEWEEDPHYQWDGDGPDPAEEGDVAHDVIVYARTITYGVARSGLSSLGGVYETPGKRDRDIHGYLPQMLEEASSSLLKDVRESRLQEQLRRAIKYLKKILKARYHA